jgi:hypothetical protein
VPPAGTANTLLVSGFDSAGAKADVRFSFIVP